jgi:hypothetical protein
MAIAREEKYQDSAGFGDVGRTASISETQNQRLFGRMCRRPPMPECACFPGLPTHHLPGEATLVLSLFRGS